MRLAILPRIRDGFGNLRRAPGRTLLRWTAMAILGFVFLRSYIFIVYTGVSIVRVFLITCSTFAAMSIYGYTTKRDLTKFGSFLIMGLIGIILASIVNIFMQSRGCEFDFVFHHIG